MHFSRCIRNVIVATSKERERERERERDLYALSLYMHLRIEAMFFCATFSKFINILQKIINSLSG